MKRSMILIAALILLTAGFLFADYFVDFEGTGETKTAYASGTVNLSGLGWNMTESLIGTSAADWKNGARSARMRGYEASSMTMLDNKANGIGTVSLYYRRYGTDIQVDWKVEYSSDDGINWIQIGDDFTAPATDDVQFFSEAVNVEGNVIIRIVRATEDGNTSNNRRLNIDDILVTDYSTMPIVATPTFDPPAGTYYTAQNVEILCDTEDADIFYSLVTDPYDWQAYTASLLVEETTTIWAYATKDGMTDSAIASANYYIPVPAYTILPYGETFDANLGDCYAYSVSGATKYWIWSSFGGNGYALMNGFNSGDIEEDWLILPGIDMDLYGEVILNFETAYNFGVNEDDNNYLKLFYSTDYEGVGDTAAAIWTELAFNLPATGGYAWAPSGNIDLSAIEGTVWLGFKYLYQPTNYRAWQIDNINIFEVLNPILTVFPTSLTGFTYEEEEGPSLSQSYLLSGINLDPVTGDISVIANDYYEISFDDVDFYDNLLVPYLDGLLNSTTIFVRLKAGLFAGDYNDEVINNVGGGTAADVTLFGNVTEPPPPPPEGYFVGFEGDGETKGSYASGTVNLSGLDWDMTEALIGTLAADWKNGERSARFRGYAASSMTMLEFKPNGAGTISFYYRRYGTDLQVDWVVEYTTDTREEWIQIGEVFTAPASDEVQLFSEVLNIPGNVKIRIKRATEEGAANRRLNIDDILITDYDEEPLACELSSFTATLTNNHFVELQWVTESETSLLGYNVYRHVEQTLSDAVKVNPMIISATNTSFQQVYNFVDQDVTINNTYYYWLESNGLDMSSLFHGPVSIILDEEEDVPPTIFRTELLGAYPNPFNPNTKIAFTLAQNANITITIYNAAGQVVKAIVNEASFNAGEHFVNWNGTDNLGRSTGSGVYFYKLETDIGYMMIKKMVLLK